MTDHLSQRSTDTEAARSGKSEPWAGISTAVLERLADRLPVPFKPRPQTTNSAGPHDVARASPATYVQKVAWTRANEAPRDNQHIIPRAYRLRGFLDGDALARSLNVLVQRHEALRTTFALFDGSLAQVVAARGMALFRRTDLTSLPAGDREFAVRRLTRRELRRPFDLVRGPMLRALLLRIDERDHVLLLSVPATAADWWSMRLLWRELGGVYTALRAGGGVEELQGSAQRDDLTAQSAGFGDADRQSLAEYGRRMREVSRGGIGLPRDRAERTGSVALRGRVEVSLDRPTAEAMQALAVAERASPYMVLLAAYAALLRRYTLQDDLLIGSPVSHRVRPELESVVGLFASLGAVHVDTSGGPSFRQLIGRVRASALQAYAQQGLAALAPADSIDRFRAPLLETAIGLRGDPGEPPDMQDLVAEMLPLDDGAPISDLMLHFEPRDGALAGIATFRADVFSAATIERLLEHFALLLKGALADPDRSIGSLPILSATERRRVLTLGRGPGQVDEDATVWSLFEAQSARSPRDQAVRCGDEVRTYCEVRTNARTIACALRDHGVGPGSRVGVLLQPSVQVPSAMLGVLAAGAAVVTLDPAASDERLGSLLDDAELAVILTDVPDESTFKWVGTHGPLLRLRDILDGPVAAGNSVPIHVPEPGEAAFVVFADNASGRPAGVVVDHQTLVNALSWSQQSIPAGPGSRFADSPEARLAVPWLPLRPLVSGALYVLGAARSGLEIAALVSASRVDLLRLDGQSLAALLEQTPTEALTACNALRAVLCDAHGLTPDLIGLFHRRMRSAGLLDVRLHSVYGCAETAAHGARWVCPPEAEAPPAMLVGRAAANARLYVVDERGGLCPVGVPGEVWIGGAPVARGYLGRADMTAERFFPDPFARGGRVFRTDDRARWRTDGQLELLGSYCL